MIDFMDEQEAAGRFDREAEEAAEDAYWSMRFREDFLAKGLEEEGIF